MAIGASLLAADRAAGTRLLLMVSVEKLARDQYSHTKRVLVLLTHNYYMGPGCAWAENLTAACQTGGTWLGCYYRQRTLGRPRGYYIWPVGRQLVATYARCYYFHLMKYNHCDEAVPPTRTQLFDLDLSTDAARPRQSH
jgi:hypothetical protein